MTESSLSQATSGGRHPEDGWTLADPRPMAAATRRALRGLVRALCARAPAPELPDLEDRLELHVRRLLQYMPPPVALGLVFSVHVVDWAPLWRLRAARRIQHLAPAHAEKILTELGESRSPLVRTLLLGIRALVLSTFYDQDEVHRAMRWEPAAFIADRVALRGRLLEGGTTSARDAIRVRERGAPS